MRKILVLSVLSLSGCATMSAEDCVTADWRSIGFADGQNGYAETQLQKRADSCMKHDVAVDEAAYADGRLAGLQLYCTPENAYAVGEQGQQYYGVCPAQDEAAFQQAYARGYGMYQIDSSLASAQNSLRSAKQEHRSLTEQLNKYSAGYRDEGMSTSDHNKNVLNIWAKRKYLEKEAVPHWQATIEKLERQRVQYLGAAEATNASFTIAQNAGPRPYRGPTEADAKQMFSEALNGKRVYSSY